MVANKFVVNYVIARLNATTKGGEKGTLPLGKVAGDDVTTRLTDEPQIEAKVDNGTDL